MRIWLRLARGIDALNEHVGRGIAWLCLLMVLVGAYNAAVRYLGRFTGMRLSSNAYIELQWYLFSVLFLLGAAHTLRHNAHVRVDVLFQRLGPRGRAWVNLAGTVVFLLPFCVVAILVSLPTVLDSWQVREMSPDPGGLPRYPIKILIPVAFALLVLQGLAEVVRQAAILKGIESEAEEGWKEGV